MPQPHVDMIEPHRLIFNNPTILILISALHSAKNNYTRASGDGQVVWLALWASLPLPSSIYIYASSIMHAKSSSSRLQQRRATLKAAHVRGFSPVIASSPLPIV